ncbi:MAG: hypothetical protein DWQ37_12700 [Planctomycetota bacterium]|nr:MAG: hypothetical protein DWQ37_12700 [Planctomycetota bacterium]
MPSTRRQFHREALSASLFSWAAISSMLGQAEAADDSSAHKLYFGDLHNHNAVGYAKGSLERSIDLAREHLDFFAFTGHASWHDMPHMPEDRHMLWVNGFKVHADHWPRTRQLIREANDERFTALLGYEWHSSGFGDYCLLFPEDQPDLFLPDHVEKLLDFADAKRAMAIPHHVGYKQGWRGANFAHFRPSVSPVVEIFSEHGCTESERAPYPMLRHSLGGRSTHNTIRRQLEKGLRFGFVASSDDHLGYPGAYGEGICGIWADSLSAGDLVAALRARRTYALTGDRIVLEVSLNDQPMGADVPHVADRQIDVRVEGQDALQMVELVKNGRVIQRHFPEDHVTGPVKLPGRAKCRVQFGWGPWAALDLGRVGPWDMTLRIRGGKFHRVLGCFQCAPFGEDLRDRLRAVSESEVQVRSFTTREQCYAEDPTKAIVCELEGQPDAVLSLELREPAAKTVSTPLSALVGDNLVDFTGGFTTESFILGPLVGPSEFSATIRWHDKSRGKSDAPDWYYVRATQHNGHMAWSSPIWVG